MIKTLFEQHLAAFPDYKSDIYQPLITETHLPALMDIIRYAQRELSKANRGFPAGFWYMGTLTSKPEDTKEDVLKNHLKIMSKLGDQVKHAALEKSNIYHVHYILCLKDYARNISRDVQNETKRSFKLGGKGADGTKIVLAKTLRQFQGLCKYVLKRDYTEDKTQTQVEMLYDNCVYEEGKGYSFKK